MRKSFTRLFGIFILIVMMSLQSFAISGPILGPTADIVNIKKTSKVVLTSDKAVTPGTGVVRLLDASGNPLKTFQATSSNVKISNVKNGDGLYEIQVDFTDFLKEETKFKLEVDNNFVKDATGGNANFAALNVFVGDYTAPSLKSTDPLSPKNGATVDVQLDQVLEVTFNEDVKIADNAKVYIYTDNGTPFGNLFETVSAPNLKVKAGDAKTIQIDATKTFVQSTKYYVTIPAGAIVDDQVNAAAPFNTYDNKNAYAGFMAETSWAFTTRDNTEAKFVKKVSDNIAKDNFDVIMQLDKAGKAYVMAVPADAAAPVLGDFIAANGMKSAEVTEANKNFSVNLTQYFNAGGLAIFEGGNFDVYAYTENKQNPTNKGAITKLFSQKTPDVTVPVIIASTPARTLPIATDVKVADVKYLKLKLSEQVVIGAGNVEVWKWDNALNHVLKQTIAAADCKVSLANGVTKKDSLYIPVASTVWESNVKYFVKFSKGIVKDPSGNELAGYATTEDWKFQMIDFIAPTYTYTAVQTGTTSANQFVNLVFDFSEVLYSDDAQTAMTAGVGGTFAATLTIKEGSSAITPSNIVLSDGDKFTVTIPVNSAKTYSVAIDTKKVFDLKGNKGTTVDSYTLNVKDYMAPVVSIKPTTKPDTDLLGKSDNIIISFDEPVLKGDGTAVDNAYVAAHVIFRKGTDATGAFVNATYTVADDAKSFIINPENDFANQGDKYYVGIGATTVEDASGNQIAATSKVLTVDDFVLPTASYKYAAGTAIVAGTPVNPVLLVPYVEFSESVKALTGNVAIAHGDDAKAYVNFKENGENVVYAATWDLTTDAAKPRINIGYNFQGLKEYTILLGTSVVDLNGNAFAGKSQTFTTFSTVAPTVSGKTPQADATAVKVADAIEVTFNENVVLAAGGITVIQDPAGVPANLTGAISFSGAVLKIAHADFSANKVVEVTVPAGAVQNAAGKPNASEIKWKFNTIDTQAPVYVNLTSDPKVDSKETDVAVADKLVLEFNEKVVLHTGTIYIRTKSNDVAVQTLTQANAKLDDSGKKLTITPVAPLAYNTSYYVEITPGLVKDVEGNSFGGFTSDVWDFATVANPGQFIVKSSVPANQNDKVALGDDFVLTLSWDAKVSTIDATKTIRLDRNTGTIDAPVWTNVWDKAANLSMFTFNGSTVTINPDDNLVTNTQYKLTVNTGVVKDNYGQDLTAYSIVFYTFDNNGPKVISTVPAKDAEKVAVNSTITIDWDETPYYSGSEATAANIKDQALVTVGGTTNYTAVVSGKSWILTMDEPFAEKSLYNVVVKQTSVKDAGNKGQTADYSFLFATADNTINKPTAFANEVNTLGTEYGFTVNFDEKGTVYYVVAPKADEDPTTQYIIDNGTKIDFGAAGTSPAQTAKGLTSNVEYTFFFVAVDAAGNKSAIYSVDKTTKDVIKPIATISSPANGATAVSATADLVLTFNEKVKVGTAGNVIIREVGTELIVETIPFNSASITYSDDKLKVTINPASVLESLTKYYVEVDGTAIVDLAGNSFASILGSDKWAFTVKDTDKPLLVSTTPALADVPEVKSGSTYTLEFNESVKAGAGALVVKYKSNIGSIITAGDEFEVVNVASLNFSVDKKVSFTLVNVPVEQTDFYVEIPTGLITDVADNKFDGTLKAGGNIGTSWDFVILDQTAPAMASAKIQKTLGVWVDAVNATGVNIATPIEVAFNEPIFQSPNASAFSNTTIDAIVAVKDAAGNVVELNADNTVFDGVKVITIDPKNDLKSETTYTVSISPVVDNKKNVTSELSFSFTTKDMTAPVASIVPVDKTSLNPKTGVVTITFNEPIYDEVVLATSENNNVIVPVVDANIGSFFTFEQVNVKADKTFDSVVKAVKFTGTISEDKKVITLTPNADQVPFVSEAWYRVVLKAGVVMDGAANPNALTTSIFQVEDIAAPKADVAANFAPQGPTTATAALTITFNEAVKVGTGNIYVRNYITGDILETIKVDEAGKVSFNDTKKVVTIAHADFVAKTNFYATADAGTFTDLVGNPWAGIKTSDINIWKFSTLDAVEPKVLATAGFMPANGTTNVGVGTNLEVTFDKQIAKNAGNVIIYNEDWTPFEVINIQSANVTFKAVTDPVFENNRVLVVNPTAELKGLSTYYVRIEAGAIKDNAGNLYSGLLDKSWSFITEDTTAPTVKNFTPKTGNSDVEVKPSLQIEFSVNVEANNAGKIYLYKEIPGQLGKLVETIETKSSNVLVETKFVTITPNTTLDYEETYYVIVDAGAFNNTSTNKLPFAGITTTQEWTFTTKADNDKPVVVKAEPNAVNGLKPAEVTLKLTLSEDVVAGTGNIVVYDAKADTVVSTIEIADATIEGAVVSAVPTGLKEGMSYYVKVDAGSLLDKASTGNAFAGIEDKLAWNFETGDFTAPAVAAKTPTMETVLTDNHPTFKLTFNEAVKLGEGGNLKVYKVGTTEAVLDIPVTAAMINGKEVTVTYTAAKGLDKSANYFVKVDGGAITDMAGNKFAGISDAAAWTFKTGDKFATPNDPTLSLEFKVYPNPFVDYVTVANASKLSKIVVTNIAGQTVKEVVNPTDRIQLNELHSGPYFISMFDMDNVIVKTAKIVKR